MNHRLLSVSLSDTHTQYIHYGNIHPAAFINTHTHTSPPREWNMFYSGWFVIVTASTLPPKHTHTHTLHFHPISFRGSVFAPDAFPVSYSGLLGKLLCLHTDRHFTVDIGGARRRSFWFRLPLRCHWGKDSTVCFVLKLLPLLCLWRTNTVQRHCAQLQGQRRFPDDQLLKI